jgi:carbon-monoxide dehydrogenase large subunit
MLVSDTTGIAMDQIDFVFGDTDLVPIGGGTGGSRSLQAGGSAVKLAADEVVELGRLRAAEALEASVDDIVLDRAVGAFHVAGTPSLRRSWADVACSSPDGLAAETNQRRVASGPGGRKPRPALTGPEWPPPEQAGRTQSDQRKQERRGGHYQRVLNHER